MSGEEHPVCGRCGVYRHLHPTKRCQKSRRSWWWDEHSATAHVTAWLWIHAVPSRARYWVLERYRLRGRDWCELFYSAYQADEWQDWRVDYSGQWGCLCDFPMPWQVGPPRPGLCYCPPDAPGALPEAVSGRG